MIIVTGESTQINYIKTTPRLKRSFFKNVITPHSHTNPAISKIFIFSNY